MLKKNYKTDKQKFSHIMRHWPKAMLLELLDFYGVENIPSVISKSKLVSQYLDKLWEIIWEEYSEMC